MFVVGLTGGLATGKSTVLQFFKNHGIPVIDADQIARKVVEPGEKAWKQIVKEFGEDILSANGMIDRAALGTLVFDDIEKRKKLNAITHPQIQKTIVKIAIMKFFEGNAFIVMELPLLFETGWMLSYIHKIVTVVCDDEQQLERLCQRNSFTTDIAQKRIACQMPLEEKINRSHFVINNAGTKEETERQTESIIRMLRESNFHWYIKGIIFGLTALPLSLIYYFLFHF